MTVNTIDNTDLFEVKTRDNEYFLDGTFHPFEENTFTVEELKDDGSLEVHELIQKKTKHGIVINELDDKVIAIRFAQMENFLPMIEQYDRMNRAVNLEQFQEALSLRQMPFLNTVYADKAGNIMHHFGGVVPKKNGGWEKWSGIVSGDSSINIWDTYYESDELPMVMNPPTGWLQNANDPPFLNTIPPVLDKDDFESHVAPLHFGFRPQRSARLMYEADNITFDELVELKHNSQVELALRIKDDLLELKELSSDTLVLDAIETMTEWDGSYKPQSMGAILFNEFTNTILGAKGLGAYQIGGFLEEVWTIEDPINTPDGFEDDHEIIYLIRVAANNERSERRRD